MPIGIYCYAFISGNGLVTVADAVSYLNSNPFVVSPTQTPVFFEFAKYSAGGLKKFTFVFLGSPGSYGGAGTLVTEALLELLAPIPFLAADFNRYTTLSITSLGTLSPEIFIDNVNSGSYSFAAGRTYLFSYIYNSVTYYMLFTGPVPGSYGYGGTLFLNTNFVLATRSDIQIPVSSSMVATSSLGSSIDNNNWTQVATINLGTDSTNDFSFTFLFQSAFARLQTAMVAFSGRQRDGVIEMLNAEILAMSAATTNSAQNMFSDDSFAIITGSNGSLQIYIKKVSTYGQFKMYELARNNFGNFFDITYYSSQPWIPTLPSATSTIISNGFSYNKQKVLTSFSAAATYSSKLDFTLSQILYSKDSKTVYNILDSYTKQPITLSRIDVLPPETEVDNIFYFLINGVYYRRNFGDSINAKSIGAGLGNNDTDVLQKALKYGARLFFPAGVYLVKEFTIGKNVEVYGVGDASILMFYTENEGDDARKWAVVSTEEGSKIHDLMITGNKVMVSNDTPIYKPGNGLLIKPAPGGMSRSIYNISVTNFAVYVPAKVAQNNCTDCSYGLNGNLSPAQLIANSSINGGNGIKCDMPTDAKSWELYMNNIRISNLDGVGFDFGFCSDSKISNFWIGNCVNAGFIMQQNNQNNQVSNLKVYRSFILNIKECYSTSITKIIPFAADLSGASGAILLTGANNTFYGLEAQENGAHGVMIGTGIIGLRHSTINNLLVDGNGGINGSTLDTANMRYGLYLNNFYNVIVNGIAQDFRSKSNASRQRYGVYAIVNKYNISAANSSSVGIGRYYRIKAVSADTDFTKLMSTQLNPRLNSVGFVFQAVWEGNQVPPGAFGGGGILESVNDNLTLIMGVSDNYDQIAEGGTGYRLNSIGNNSTVIINGNAVVNSVLRTECQDIGNYNINRLDNIVAYTSLTESRTVLLPPVKSAIRNKKYVLKDETGAATSTKSITLRPDINDSGVTIDGSSSKVINTAYGSLTVYCNGSQWFLI